MRTSPWTIRRQADGQNQVFLATHNHDSVGDAVATTTLPGPAIRQIIGQECKPSMTRQQRMDAVRAAIRIAEEQVR